MAMSSRTAAQMQGHMLSRARGRRCKLAATHDERTIMEVWRFGHFLRSRALARRSATSLRVPTVHTNSQEPPE